VRPRRHFAAGPVIAAGIIGQRYSGLPVSMLETQNSDTTAKFSAVSTPPDSAPELPVCASPPGAPATCDVTTRPGASAVPSAGARRARLHRRRRRQGLRPVQVLLHERDIEALVRLGHLREKERQDLDALQRAVYSAVDMALDRAKLAIARERAPHRNG
jgi:hypothetical protein